LLRSDYGPPLQAAFEQALADLGDRDRTALRMHLVDGLSIDQIGKIFGVHRSTAARWLARAGELIVQSTRRHLAERLSVDIDIVDSIIRLV
jgi:RNA polymerase sigma-70 factor (ECF subfamily)